jgi:Ca2+-binding EF-hand superfamily protein
VQRRSWEAFGDQISKQAFIMFDRSRVDQIDFKEFCLGLAIICLGGSHNKIRFIFDLFDEKKKGMLEKKEQLKMLKAASIILMHQHGDAVKS